MGGVKSNGTDRGGSVGDEACLSELLEQAFLVGLLVRREVVAGLQVA